MSHVSYTHSLLPKTVLSRAGAPPGGGPGQEVTVGYLLTVNAEVMLDWNEYSSELAEHCDAADLGPGSSATFHKKCVAEGETEMIAWHQAAQFFASNGFAPVAEKIRQDRVTQQTGHEDH